MTIQLNDITIQSTDNLALTYGVMTNPNPLQIDTTGSISIVVSKSARPAAQCTSLTFSINIGTAATDLTATPSTISASPPPNWGVSSDGNGNFTFTPNPGQGEIGPTGLSFVLSNIDVNKQVGTTELYITETLQSGTSSGSIPIPKFPQGFTVSDLIATPASVAPGGTATLSWSGTAGGVYTLSYGSLSYPNLPNVYTFPVPPLQQTTNFTLTVTADGGLMLQRQCTVTVNQPIIQEFGVAGNQSEFLVGSEIQLYWTTENAVSCSLKLNGITIAQNLSANMDASQGYPVTVPLVAEAAQYMLYAYDSTGKYPTSLPLTISVFQFKLLPNPIGNITYLAGQMVMRTDGTLYIAGSGLDVVSTASNTIIHSIQWPNLEGGMELSSNSMVMSPDESQLYVLTTNNVYPNSSSVIQVVNLSNYQVRSIPVPWLLGEIAMGTHNGRSCLVATDLVKSDDPLGPSSCIYVLDPSNNCGLIQKLALPNLSMDILAAVASPQGDRIFLCSIDGSDQTDSKGTTLYTYTIASNTLSQVQFSGIQPSALGNAFAFSAVSNRYYIGGAQVDLAKKQFLPAIAVIDANTNQVVDTILFPDPNPFFDFVRSLVLSPDGLHLYAQVETTDMDGSGSDTIVRINLNTFQVVGTVASPNDAQFQSWAVKPDGTCLYGVVGNTVSTLYLFEISDGLNALRASTAS
nr:MAG: hypothetical protein EDM05_17640 [Leptolyngbya sp. IPPAS B-1204]